MNEYKRNAEREKMEEHVAETTIVHDSVDLPTYMSLAAQYGLEDDMEIGQDDNVQSVEQEFQAYVTGALSAKTIDILKYWEVNSNLT